MDAKIQSSRSLNSQEDRLANLGPGGLDPSDVFESLPQSMKACFESQDIGLLQTVIKELPEEEAR